MTHLCSLDTRYHAALKPDFMAENQPPMYLTLYFLTNRPSFCAIFLFLDPIELTLASFETPPPFVRGAPPPFSRLLLPLLLHLTSLELRRSALRLPLVGSTAAGLHILGVGVGAVGVVEVALAVAVVGVVEVAVVGVVEVALAVEMAGVVEAVGVVGVVEGERVAVGVELEGVEARVQLPEELSLVVQLVEVEIPGVDNKTSHIGKRLLGRSSYVSGLPSEAAQEAEVASSTSTSYSCSSCMRTCGGGGGCRHWNC
ncbi:unnamed protein product [Closterium sp. NIES-54]